LDYRQLTGQFDRVVPVGRMEHVGIGHFDEYFLKIRELLTSDGYAFVHCIGRMSQLGTTGPIIRKYILPGAYVPALSGTFAATERCGLWCDDREVLRLHYYTP
jgi:cyclopropane-fatty-acyl-phospholipid synthase